MPEPTPAACDHDSQVIEHEGTAYWACLKCGHNHGPVDAPAPPPADVRDQIAAAVRTVDIDYSNLVMGAGQGPVDDDEAHALADAVLRVPAIAEALTAVGAVADITRSYCPACGRGDAAPTTDQWLQERRRAERAEAALTEEWEASRRLLEQRQEMAAERYAWQQRGDRAETELSALKRAHVALASQAGNDQAAVARVRALAERWRHTGDRKGGPLRELLAALDPQEPS